MVGKPAPRTIHAPALTAMLAVLSSAILVIGVYGHLRCSVGFRDPLSTKLGAWDLDGWSLTHLAWFTLIAYVFPGRKFGVAAFIGGIVWELIEHFLGHARPSWLGGWGDCDAAEFEKENANWWFGRSSDIIMNGLGIIAGNLLQNAKRRA